jgi:hypothetical protein
VSTPIRVVIAAMPAVLAEVVAATIGGQADLQLVGQAESQEELRHAISNGCDILILGASQVEQLPGSGRYLLSAFPDMRIIVVATDAAIAVVYWRGLRHEHELPLIDHQT